MDLQLVGGLHGGAHDVNLEPGVAPFVEVYSDDEHDAFRHFDTKLAPVGTHRGASDRAAAKSNEAVCDAAQVVERHRSNGGSGHSGSSAKNGDQ